MQDLKTRACLSPSLPPARPRVLFCLDMKVLIQGRKVFSHPSYGYWWWKRYLQVFSELMVACRFTHDNTASILGTITPSDGDGVSFLEIPNLSTVAGLTYRRPQAVRLLSTAIRLADAVICRLPSEIGLVSASLARRRGKPYLIELIACPLDAYKNYGSRTACLYAPIVAARVRAAVAAAPFVTYPSNGFLQGRYPTAGRSAALSDVELPASHEAVLARRLSRIRTLGRDLVLGLIGSWENKIKGIETALDALAGMNADRARLSLRVLGSGDPVALQEMARSRGVSRVQACALLPSGQPIFDWLDDIDLYIQPSFTEGLPRGLIEAMSRACPAIGSTAGGIPELLPPARLHRPGDACGLARLIGLLAGDRSHMEMDARQNFERSRSFSPDRLNEKRRRWLEEFATHAAAPRST